ncbi:flavin reductase family protein [Streptomyces bambusae]|uniref:flavin reductase family protein n=1 Tax=Streptomyces bambusae TaxID=1550616 RepID=UPI001CFF4D5B|nr:flavin reductase family protein [Streptomyces bambusae]MCB5165626.1 flavin reductase family protein [Streptomyces bambusae]
MSLMAAPSAELVDIDDRKQLRGVLGAFPTGVTVVTVGGEQPRGMTANSFTSVSLAPPLVLICVNNDAVMHQKLAEASTFSVSVLSAGQEDVARHFANHSRPAGTGQFEAVDWVPGRAGTAPLIAGAVAHLECEKWRVYDGGDHTIYLGEVLTAGRRAGSEALLFAGGRFRQVVAERSEGRAA